MRFGAESLLALRPGSWARVPGVGVLWSSSDDRRQVWLEPGSEPVLERLRPFDRVVRHRERLTSLFGDPARAEAILDRLAAHGLLIDANELLATVEPAAAAPQATPSVVAIRSYRRPEALGRLLDGLCTHQDRFGGRQRVLVIDDTVAGEPKVAALVAAARASGLDVGLFAAPQRAQWLGRIGRRFSAFAPGGPLRGSLDPAITAATGARSWNTALLFAAGGLLSLLDDDFYLPWRERRAPSGVAFGDPPPVQIAYHRPEVPEPEACFDVLAAAQSLCGKPALSAVPVQDVDVLGLSAADVLDWRQRRIGAVITGTYGAYAWDSTVYVNLNATPEQLLATPFDPALLEGDAMSFAVQRPSLVPRGAFTPLAIDLRDFAPFTPNVGKADDIAFLHLLGAVRPRHAALEMPWLIGHAPPEPRQRRVLAEGPLLADPGVLFGARVSHMAAQIDGADAIRRWSALGSLAATLAADDEAALAGVVRRWRVASVAQVIGLARRALDRGATAPVQWRDHVSAILRANQGALNNPDDGLSGLVVSFRDALRQLSLGEEWVALWELAEREAADWQAAVFAD